MYCVVLLYFGYDGFKWFLYIFIVDARPPPLFFFFLLFLLAREKRPKKTLKKVHLFIICVEYRRQNVKQNHP